ncbi:zonular occludens toxin domain-containing protein (plasmid) [Photobacterium sp. DA100]|uniref:zonular occludens toxin domain-containing protein n=1 Tax=Photobacterium sp. DA100 TaxID=3027472 RepID=UPI00247893BB|nr:zonular occludens toxin domain-containing protein [Photobacterium sp. DA100]WEM45791.1 zonular occludens toxin domain-containing protein [Photobacterium sp. DA100]
MEYGISGLPGAGKTLNTIDMVTSESNFEGREVYYHRIPLLMLDFDVCSSFQGWFYGWYLHNNKSNTALVRKVQSIHKKEDRFIELEDFPYLKQDHSNSNPVEILLYWVRRVYSKERLAQLDEYLTIKQMDETALTFDQLKPLNYHWTHFDNPKSWVELPNQSVIVMDEIHHYWPPRTRGDVPKELEAISTHRHTGKDLVFITQDFANVDIFIRRMMNYHTHYEFAGADRVACYKKKKYIDISNPFEKKAADKSLVKRPVHLYGSYYSTELDTNNNKLSKGAKRGLILGAASIFAFLLMLFVGFPYVYSLFFSDEQPTDSEIVSSSDSTIPTTQKSNTDILAYQPMIKALPWTAPIYNGGLEPASYPDLMCYQTSTDCRCITQQATAYSIELESCLSIANNGLFDPHLASTSQRINKKTQSKGLFK